MDEKYDVLQFIRKGKERRKMAYRLPPAGLKSKESEHFAYCKVLPKSEPKQSCPCPERVGACLLSPKLVVLPTKTPSTRPDRSNDLGDQECCYIRCCCEDTDWSAQRKLRQEPRRPSRQYEDIIVLEPPGGDTESDMKWAGSPGCQLPNMRRREVPVRELERQWSSVLVETVDDPFMVIANKDSELVSCEGNSQDVNVGSLQDSYRLSKPDNGDRCCFQVIPRDCRPRVPDFRRRKSTM